MPIPVAIFTYRRSAHTRATLEALAANTLAPQTDLYIFSDGPKSGDDVFAVKKVRELIKQVTGFASVTIIERSTNMGLAQSIIVGVSELFEKFECIIVLEDDLVTTKYFLSYMNAALDHYQNDPFVFSVTGHTFPKNTLRIPKGYLYDTYAAYRCSSWSWGTWRDRWARVDWDMRYFECFCKDEKAQEELSRGGRDMTEMLHMQHRGQIDSWAIRFCYAHSANNMKCIYPIKTLVSNIGLDNSGTHSVHDSRFVHLKFDADWQPAKFSPAEFPNPEITARFRAIWDTPSAKGAVSFYLPVKIKIVNTWKWLKGLI